MSSHLKTGFIVAAAGVAAYLIYRNNASSAVPGIPGATSSPTATAPGAAPSVTSTPGSSGGSSTASKIVKYGVIATVAPFYYPAKVGIAVAKSAGGAIESGAKSVVSAIGSIF